MFLRRLLQAARATASIVSKCPRSRRAGGTLCQTVRDLSLDAKQWLTQASTCVCLSRPCQCARAQAADDSDAIENQQIPNNLTQNVRVQR
eukprot:3261235-Pyramimonas_sp.AAC.1